MYRRKTLIFVFVFSLIFHAGTSYGQESDSACNKIYEGYIVRVFEKCQPFALCNFDVFFCIQKPEIKEYASKKYRKRYLDSNQYGNIFLLNERYYEDVNRFKYSSESFDWYYMSKPIDSIRANGYGVDMYRVVLAGYVKRENVKNYTDINGTSHHRSVFKNYAGTMPNVNVLYPSLIVVW